MAKYVVLVVDDDEDRWETLTDEQRQERWDGDYAFGQLLEERGGKLTGGAGLTHSRRTRVVTRDGAATDGPYAESTEQISGFFIVECDSLEDLTEATRPMAATHHHLEIRPVNES